MLLVAFLIQIPLLPLTLHIVTSNTIKIVVELRSKLVKTNKTIVDTLEKSYDNYILEESIYFSYFQSETLLSLIQMLAIIVVAAGAFIISFVIFRVIKRVKSTLLEKLKKIVNKIFLRIRKYSNVLIMLIMAILFILLALAFFSVFHYTLRMIGTMTSILSLKYVCVSQIRSFFYAFFHSLTIVNIFGLFASCLGIVYVTHIKSVVKCYSSDPSITSLYYASLALICIHILFVFAGMYASLGFYVELLYKIAAGRMIIV